MVRPGKHRHGCELQVDRLYVKLTSDYPYQPAWDELSPNQLERNEDPAAHERDYVADLKEALSIHATPEDARFNRDGGYKLPDCWIATYNKLRGGASFSNARRPTRGAHDQACAN